MLNPLANLASLVVGSILVLLVVSAGPLVYVWDHGAFDAWSWTSPGFFHITLRLPESIAGRDAAALQTERQAFEVADGALEAQNAAVTAWSLRGRIATSAASKAIQALAVAERAAVPKLRIIESPLPQSDTCSRYQAADAQFVESLQP